MTEETENWLKSLAKMEIEAPVAKVDAKPRSDAPLPISGEHPERPQPRKMIAAMAVMLILVFISGLAAGTFFFSHTLSGNVGSTPVSGPASLSIGTLPPCNMNCNGTLVSGPNGYAVTFAVTAVNAQVQTSDSGFFGLWIVPTTTTACGSNPPGSSSWVQIPQTMSAITVAAQQYKYCVFYTSLVGGQQLSLTVNYQV